MPNPLYTYIGFGLVGFYAISTIVSYLMPNPLYTDIKYIGFGLVGFYAISTIVGYLMPNPFYKYIYIFFHMVKWFRLFLSNTNNSIYNRSLVGKQFNVFQVLLCITNNSIKHQSFVYTIKWSNSSIFNNWIKHQSFVYT